MDGPHLPLPEDDRRGHSARPQRRRAPDRLRHHHGTNNQFHSTTCATTRSSSWRTTSKGHHFAIVTKSTASSSTRHGHRSSSPDPPRNRRSCITRSTGSFRDCRRGHPGRRQGRRREALHRHTSSTKSQTVTLTESGMAKAEQMLTSRLSGAPLRPGKRASNTMSISARAHTRARRRVPVRTARSSSSTSSPAALPGRRWATVYTRQVRPERSRSSARTRRSR